MNPPQSWMSDRNRSLHNAFTQKIVMAVYAVGFDVFWFAILVLGFALGLFKQWSDVLVPIFALSVLPAWWFSKITAYHMAYDDQTFRIAAQNTFYPMILKLAFVPVLGPLAERILKYQKPENPFIESPKK
jgi:hypothetical protein